MSSLVNVNLGSVIYQSSVVDGYIDTINMSKTYKYNVVLEEN